MKIKRTTCNSDELDAHMEYCINREQELRQLYNRGDEDHVMFQYSTTKAAATAWLRSLVSLSEKYVQRLDESMSTDELHGDVISFEDERGCITLDKEFKRLTEGGPNNSPITGGW